MAATKRIPKKRAPQKRSGRLAPRKEQRGLDAADVVLAPDADDVASLGDEVRQAGGAVVAAYREPLSGRPLLLAALPIKSVQPTPFQRDLSPTHVKRLAAKIEESGAFLDPLVVVRGETGQLWTPNGRHRLAAAKVLGLRHVMALVSPHEDLAYRILALNTEKAHNLKDKSLEVIRMARNVAGREPRARESDYSAQFEAPELLTLGIVYTQNKRFAGGAYSPLLKKLDRFSDRTLRVSLREREGHAARLEAIDNEVKKIVGKLQAKGFRSPYLRAYVVARINPVRFHRPKKGDTAPPMSVREALTRMAAAARKFDVTSVRPGELALVGTLMGGDS